MKSTFTRVARRTFSAVFAMLVLSCAIALATDRLPNIVVILSDDYGYGSAGCYGANAALEDTEH